MIPPTITPLGVAVLVLSAGPDMAAREQRPHLDATIERVAGTASDTSLSLRIAITTSPGWHIGARRPGAVGEPTHLSWRLPLGWRLVDERWPAPQQERTGRDTALTYSGSLGVDASLAMERTAGRAPIQVVLSYVICREVCIPGRVTLTYDR